MSVLLPERVQSRTSVGDDEAVLAGVNWRNSVPRGVRRAAEAGDLAEFGRRMRAQSPFRRAQKRIARLTAHDGVLHPCLQPLWSRRAFPATDRGADLTELLCEFGREERHPSRKARSRRNAQVAALLESLGTGSAPDPFEQLCVHSLLLYASGLTDELFGRLWACAYGWWLDLSTPDCRQVSAPLSDDQRLLIDGELAVLSAGLLADIRGARRRAAAGANFLRRELAQRSDSDGVPHARLLERLPLWLAPFTRAAFFAETAGATWWDKPSRRRFRKLVSQSAALCRSSGRIALSNGVASAPVALLRTAARLAGFKARHRASQYLLAIDDDPDLVPAVTRNKTLASIPRSRVRLPSPDARGARRRPAAQSDWAQLACLRNNWGVGADACVIAFDGPVPRIDLTAFGSAVLSGAWDQSSTRRGDSLPAVEGWECVCWCSDDDADYVEIQGASGGVATVLRQALLSRNDHFLFLNDVLRLRDPAANDLTHALELPFAAAATAAQDALTREWRVRLGALRVRVFPLGLEQETVRGAGGRLEIDDVAIRLTGTAAGPGICCPLFLDWSPARRSGPVQWQSLTVAENGAAVPPWQARGWRLRVGDHQWVFYHSLEPGQTARTVLGLHTFDETVIGEFDAAGKVGPIMMVQAASNPAPDGVPPPAV